VLATTPNELLTSDLSVKTAGDLARQRAEAAIAALSADDLKRVIIMIEALASERV
jgi:hypothetical protein